MDETSLLNCLIEQNRRKILRFLGEKERSVSEIVAHLGKEQSVVSHHLSALKCCGLVKARRDGKYVKYSVANPRIVRFLQDAEKLAREIKGERC